MRRSFAFVVGVLVLVSTRSGAFQTDKLKSGPQAGESVPGPFHFLNINGAYAGDPHCLVCEYGLKPVAAVFARSVPETGKPLANLLQKLDETVGKNQASEFRGFAAFLSPDHAAEDTRKDLVQKLERVANELALKQIILCAGADSPDKYNINKDADVTVILYHNHKVVANFAYEKDKLGDKEAAAIVAAFEKMRLKR